MAEAELLISPDIVRADLQRAMKSLDKAMKDAAKRAGDEFEDELEKGILAGVKRGARRAGGAIKGAFDKMGGGRAAAGGLGALLMSGAMANIARADAAGGIMEERLGQGTNKAMMGTASLLGVDAGTMRKLWSMGQRAGFDDYRDFADILTNIQLKVTEAETGEDPSLNQFKGLRGSAMLEQVFSSIAASDPHMRTYWLDKFEAGERLSEMERFLQSIPKGATIAGTGGHGIGPDGKMTIGITGGTTNAPAWLTLSEAEKAAGLTVEERARMEQNFTLAQMASEQHRAAGEFGAIDSGTLRGWMDDQKRITQEHVTLLNTYEANLKAAIPIRQAMEKGISVIAENTSTMAAKLTEIANKPGGAGNPQNWLEGSPTFGPGPKTGG